MLSWPHMYNNGTVTVKFHQLRSFIIPPTANLWNPKQTKSIRVVVDTRITNIEITCFYPITLVVGGRATRLDQNRCRLAQFHFIYDLKNQLPIHFPGHVLVFRNVNFNLRQFIPSYYYKCMFLSKAVVLCCV